MFRFIFKRVAMVIPTFIGITLLTFALIHLIPGDPIEIRMGERGLSPEVHQQMMHQLGLDKSLPEQYFDYLKGIAHGDFGTSFKNNVPVLDEFLSLFPATIELAVFAILFAVIIGIPIGILAAIKRGSIFDHSVMAISLTGYSMPIFWWGLLLMLLVSVQWNLTPVSGRIDAEYWVDSVTGFMLIDSWLSGEPGAFKSAVMHLILPSIVLGTIPLAVISRMTRSSMLEVLGEDYIRTARAKGLSSMRVIVVHALRNALIPVVTVIGLIVGQLLSGAILTETIFSWPGIGKWVIEAIRARDYPVVQSAVLIIATIIILVNLLVDLLYGVVNPRIRYRK
ncbi:ABC transporter permease subunit [Gallibacterium anatis]|uniref:Dipeptide transport system permease protein dppB n=3 Tax=Gallibacterium anatis TaxID=750 RepID=A0A0A2XSJ1_9PAST|nr:ABC transporter permease subunit [Gallibacterium anatis]ERF79206.1 peptide ABC transporter permease [Gallibacterium anatis 12656/12]KGQ28305.1 peptide ABC transporter permease [Gallibacterium anatis]KGQ33650.1 peptide ABC transporter permease [Gallibacterium anatis]KGQ40962.1 peptide ABC transporter permease [Gallibacterium anatis]KGQ51593.1 peptide ABC transporter permease [Gallibacterium anatis]